MLLFSCEITVCKNYTIVIVVTVLVKFKVIVGIMLKKYCSGACLSTN